MLVPDPVVYIAVSSAVGLQGWLLKELIEIKTKLAIVTTELLEMKNQQQKERTK